VRVVYNGRTLVQGPLEDVVGRLLRPYAVSDAQHQAMCAL
jgi:hypothetical protein